MTPEQLEALVKKMRELGVVKCGDVELGPTPPERTDDEKTRKREADREAREEARRHEIMFAASTIRPKLGMGEP